jgi:ATP-binding cassette subfamily B protein
VGPAAAALGGLFVLQQVAGPVRYVVGEALGRRYQGRVHRRVMRAVLGPATLRHLEDPALHDQVQRALPEGGMLTSGAPYRLAALAAERLRGAAALLVVAHFSAPLALLLAAVWLHHLRRLHAVHRELIAVRWRRTAATRYGEYLGDLPLTAEAAKEVRVFGLGAWLGDRFEGVWAGAMAELWQRRRGLAPAAARALLPVLAAEALALGLLARAAVAGELGLGALVAYAGAVLQSQAAGDVSDSDLAVQYATAGLRPLAALERDLARAPALALPGARRARGLPRRGIRFEGVGFGYPERPAPVLRGLDLELPAGRSLAVVGANGAGKTTLVKLLCRLYDPEAGRITVDGTDLRELDARAWQRQVAALFQDFVRYELPAYDNVALGAPARQEDAAAVEAAARRAGALDLIEGLPRGWQTVLSRRYAGGTDLSGGQWQRIGLARALFAAAAGAGVLVLDEPTAHLDVRAEAAFYDAFLDLTRGLTTVLISHRFSTVRRADTIVVLEDGAVLESGSHAELVARGGRYARLFALQAQRFADAPTGAPADDSDRLAERGR